MTSPASDDTGYETPVERALRVRHRRSRLATLALMLLLGVVIYQVFGKTSPVTYDDIGEHFKYGSIGSDIDNGLPYWIWKVMPALCSDHLNARGDGSGSSYDALGFLSEPDHDRPIGFAKRKVTGIELVGLNCAVCHTGTYRRTPDGERQILAGMPANQLDLLSYFEFLFDCAGDPKFTVANVLASIDQVTTLGPIDRLIYERAVPQVRDALLIRAGRLAPLRQDRFRSGKGRIDTFNPYKAMVLNFPNLDESVPGASDYPSIWRQDVREHMQLHWDGNNDSLDERNISAAIGAGVTPVTIDQPQVKRIASWLKGLPAPRNPVAPEAAGDDIARGKELYGRHCQSCHGSPDGNWQGGKVGTVENIATLGTDPGRLRSHSYRFLSNQWTIGAGLNWRFKHFRKSDGYANMPLDGIWARAPYLHNGSVPTLRDLLARPPSEPLEARAARVRALVSGTPQQVEQNVRENLRQARSEGLRPLAFYRGYDVLDPANVGFVVDRGREGPQRYMLYQTTREGCDNGGHLYGTELAEAEKQQLLEYMKTF